MIDGGIFAELAGLTLSAEGKTTPTYVNAITFASALGVFLVGLFILQKTAWPKIMQGLDEREQKILQEIKSAEESRRQAEKAQEEYAAELANARAEANRLIEQTKAEQTRMAADLKQQAEQELSAMRESATRNIEAAKRAALREIYAEAATLSTTVAAKILEREVNEQDQHRLVEESLAEVSNEFARG